MADLSKLSDADLEAIASGDMSKVSDEGLYALSGEQPRKPSEIFSGEPTVPMRRTSPSRQYSSRGQVYLDRALPYVNPLIEGGMSGAGGVVGAMSPVPGGAVLGGSLMYGASRPVTRYLEQLAGRQPSGNVLPTVADYQRPEYGPLINAILQGGGDVQEGLAFELGPLAALKTGAKVVRGGRNTLRNMDPENVATRKAAQRVDPDALRLDSPEDVVRQGRYQEVIDEAISSLGINRNALTLAQRTGRPRQAAFEQSLARDAEFLGPMRAGDDAVRGQARSAVDTAIQGNVDDALDPLARASQQLQATYDLTEQEVQSLVAQLSGGRSRQQIGSTLLDLVESAKQARKGEASALFDALPDSPVKAKMLAKDFAGVRKGARLEGRPSEAPSNIMREIMSISKKASQEAGKRGEINFQTLRGYRSNLSRLARETSSDTERRYLNQTIDAIDRTLDGVQGNDAYAHARQTYKEYIDDFTRGEVGNITKPGRKIGGTNINVEDIPERFFKGGRVSDVDGLVKVIGKEDAQKVAQEFYDAEIATMKNEKQVASYINQNKEAMNKLGLSGRYQNVESVYKRAIQAKDSLDEFNKSIAGKVLGVDPGNEIKAVFSGKNKAQNVQDLLKRVGNNKKAVAGLQRAYWDNLQEAFTTASSTGQGKEKFATFYKKFNDDLPALRVLFKDSPEKLKSIKSYLDIVEALAQNKNVSYAGGSTTAEKLANANRGNFLKGAARLAAVLKGYGWGWHAVENMASSGVQMLSNKGGTSINDILKRAVYDPDLAFELGVIARTGKPSRYLKDVVDQAMLKPAPSGLGWIDDLAGVSGLAAQPKAEEVSGGRYRDLINSEVEERQ